MNFLYIVKCLPLTSMIGRYFFGSIPIVPNGPSKIMRHYCTLGKSSLLVMSCASVPAPDINPCLLVHKCQPKPNIPVSATPRSSKFLVLSTPCK